MSFLLFQSAISTRVFHQGREKVGEAFAGKWSGVDGVLARWVACSDVRMGNARAPLSAVQDEGKGACALPPSGGSGRVRLYGDHNSHVLYTTDNTTARANKYLSKHSRVT